ncbi:unnamed protein product [Diatraea saccharalis]|uniref:Carboxylic ester hydrolase n=1 Tax=Diatraea saccharalis TaxID=40085 RepID=A0A9N9RFT8_9NEOP|nr:unnamed protein product [Diatraea saccharalis]
MLSNKWLVLWSLWAARLVRQPTPAVRVSGGWLRGTVAPAGTHVQYLGVPYATVPNRFQAPDPHLSWAGVFEATDEHIRCTQRLTTTTVSGREDCLTMNIYTPPKSSKTLRPVMVFIHGGGFRDGSGSPFIYGPEYLVKLDVILVTFNYRLEILGFLCLGIKEAPGNAGLKDQVAALKWVRRNIEAFGGDPENVTIFGESAGSASVMYHLLSPMSKSLFQRAIMQSGSAISPWSFQFEPLQTAILLAKGLGYETKDPNELYRIFMSKTGEELMRTRVHRNDGDIVLSENIFVPCVEKNVPGVDQFLDDTPYNLLVNGRFSKVPLIIGHNNAEGYMFVGKENDTTISKLSFYGAMPRDLKFPSEEEKIETAKKLKELYMGNEEISKNILKFSFFVGESSISYPTIMTTHMISKMSVQPIYSYKFSYDGWLNFVKKIFGYSGAPGATHADELFYIFKIKIPALVHEYVENEMIERMTSMWTNFAKYGDPTPQTASLAPTKWRPIDKEDPHLLLIDKHFTIAPLWDKDTILYWNDTYANYRRTS